MFEVRYVPWIWYSLCWVSCTNIISTGTHFLVLCAHWYIVGPWFWWILIMSSLLYYCSSYKSSLGLIYYFTLSDQNNCLPIYPFGNQFLEISCWNSFGFPLLSSDLSFSITSVVCFKNSNHMPASYGVSSSTLTIKSNIQLFYLIKYCL